MNDIPLRMISYGSSNNDVAFIIKTSDKKGLYKPLMINSSNRKKYKNYYPNTYEKRSIISIHMRPL